MSDEERRTVIVTTVVLLVASALRFGWEARPLPPVLPLEEIPEELIEETRNEVERRERMTTPLAPGERLDPNRAPDVELARLPGVGPALAARIIADREAHGPFRRPDDLLRVRGIGPATLERFQESLDVSEVPRGTAPSSRRDRSLPDRLSINRADANELEALPGIGPALADRIVANRESEGPFQNTSDLLRVSGIGPVTLERIRPMIRTGF